MGTEFVQEKGGQGKKRALVTVGYTLKNSFIKKRKRGNVELKVNKGDKLLKAFVPIATINHTDIPKNHRDLS